MQGCVTNPAPSPSGGGAPPRCARCPLRSAKTGDPVGPEIHPHDKVILLGEAPGTHEVMEGRPFVGPSGMELQRALDHLGIRRDLCHITNTIQCRPPKNDLEAANIMVSRANRKLRQDDSTAEQILRPATACRGRLLQELEQSGIKNIVCLGKTAAKAVRGGDLSIMGIRGGCEQVPAPWNPKVTLKVAYTIHPSFVLRMPAYREVFQHDLRKAFRFFSGSLQWKEPRIVITNDPDKVFQQLQRFRTLGAPLAYDVETDSIDPMTAAVRCIALSNEDEALVIPTLGIKGNALMAPAQEKKIKEMLRDILLSDALILGHNAGQYDRLVCEQWLGQTPHLAADTLLLHLLADNELPHNLGFVGSFYTDNPEAWKADHTATEAKTDRELHIYCGKDACVTARIATPLALDVKKRGQTHLLPREHMLQSLGVAMQTNGMHLDRERLEEKSLLLEHRAKHHLAECHRIGGEKFNPQSTQQMAKLLFKDWGLAPHHYSEKTGDPSTDDTTLRAMLIYYGLDEEKVHFINSVRAFRKASKLLSTYIRPLMGSTVTRVHPSYNRLPATGRYSSSNPNMQNQPYSIRDMYVAKPGHLLVGADMDQLEMRLIAEEARAVNSLRVINDKLDPHNETMEVIYGPEVWALDGAPKDRKAKGTGQFKDTRSITKNVRYAWQYAASVKRIHEQVVSVEDDEGSLIFSHMQVEDVRQVIEGLKRADPEIPKWWRVIESKYRREGFIGDSLWDRRRYFRNEDKLNELVNHPIQSGGVHIVHEGMIELFYGVQDWFATEAVDSPGVIMPLKWLINHGHDALYLEVPEEEAEEAAAALGMAMTRRRKEGALLTYTAAPDVGYRWTEV